MIIGVTGTAGAGKDTFARYLVKNKGFEHISLSDIIREEAMARKMELTRRNLQDLGNRMRRAAGRGVFSQKALAKIQDGKNYVVTSIRNPGEAEVLARAEKFVLIAVEAPQKERFLRISKRLRKSEKEPLTFEEFEKSEKRELKSSDKSSQQLVQCIGGADFAIANDSDLAAFYGKIEELLRRIDIDL